MIDRLGCLISLDSAEQKLSVMLDEMRNGGLGGCDPTWAAHFAASTHEAIAAINVGLSGVARELTKPAPFGRDMLTGRPYETDPMDQALGRDVPQSQQGE